ncbi:MAG TPA: glycosyltransferase family 4 protein [Candidatus Nanoarchaeia archaeon]|nr:glycosyltransferase family 4 protein [Candidatus Nanoarchaeia archaeon]
MNNQKPKLLLVADTYYPKVDGTLKFMEEFMKRAQDNFDISLLVPDYGIHKGKKVHYIKMSKIWKVSGYANLKFSPSNLKKIKTAIQEADLVFVQGPAMISYLSIHYARKFNKKIFFYTHTLSWELFEKFFPRLIKKPFSLLVKKVSIAIYNRCNEILVPYHELKEQLELEGVRTAVTTARLGVDIDVFNPAADKRASKEKIHLNPDKKVIGYVGRISKEKNTDLLLEAFHKIEDQENIFLLMVGDGPEKQTREFKEIKNCKVTGFVNNVQDYLKAVDVFVMPSLTETTSLATLEAMSTGIPVIATRVGFIKNYIIKNHNGLFFPRNSSSMLSVKIAQLVKDRELRDRLGQNARKTVAYGFSWERSINRIKRILLKQYYH